jgi:glycosyltransferase involved in cell wall biosynthesis
VLEIMASGTALVATPVGGIGAVATDRQTARIVPEKNAEALAVAIADLLGQPLLREHLGRQARATICRDYSWTRVAEQFDAIYEHVGGRMEVPT